MTAAVIQPSFAGGELSPSFWGHTDHAKFRIGASTMRNCFVSIRGGAYSRPGTLFCGQAKQPASAGSTPPRIMAFQFKVNQSYILEFGDFYVRFIANGGYITEAPLAVSAATQANPVRVTVPGSNFVNGDWVFAAGWTGMTELNGETFVVSNQVGTSFNLTDRFGNPVNSTAFAAYAGGGTLARIYTVATPYLASDLPYLKSAQSADLMSLCLSDPITANEYAPQDLDRLAANGWTLSPTSFGSSIAAPATCTATPSNPISSLSSADNVAAAQYAYCVTSIDATTGEESVASPIAYTPSDNTTGSVDISLIAGSITITWAPVANASGYNVYKAPAAIWDTGPSGTNATQVVPIGSAFGFVGSAVGNQFVDQNVIQDFTTTPPLHQNPFAPGEILGVGAIPVTGTFAQATTTAAITTATGSNAVIIPVVVGGNVVAAIIQNAGQLYETGDTVTFTDSGSAATTTAPLIVGPESGTYPGVVTYFQERRGYADTFNNPDTYFFTQPGAFTNLDQADPPIDSSAITGSPWAQQVNGIQWMVPMPGGLIVCTGLDCWQLSGASGPATPLTPSSQNATAQESYGFSPTLPPIRIGAHFLYVDALDAVVRDNVYNFFTNTYAGDDLTELSNHLFDGHQIVQWAWARTPFKLLWAVRDDGVLLSLTYLKEQEVIAWARHDTNGEVVSIAVASEPPVNAVYIVVKRFIAGKNAYAYYVERLDDRLWANAEQAWCVDAGLSLPLVQPNAALSVSSATGSGSLAAVLIDPGGGGYTAPTAQLIDPTGAGAGAQILLTIDGGGAINGYTIPVPGTNYSAKSYIQIEDPTGNGAVLIPFLNFVVTYTASAGVFDGVTTGVPGQVIRMGGGKGAVLTYVSPTQVTGNLLIPITATTPNDPTNLVQPQAAGTWSVGTPVQTITGLDHLEGMTVTGLADGAVITPTIVKGGAIALASPASAVTVGLPFQAQVQTMHLLMQGAEIQGKRKRAHGATVRVEKSRGVKLGANQPNASAQENGATIAWGQYPWGNMDLIPEVQNQLGPNSYLPLFTGDHYIPLDDDWNTPGQSASPGMIAAQQDFPLPMQILAVIPDFSVGDNAPP